MSHDQLQSSAFIWAHNTYPLIRGTLFAVLNEIKKLPCETRHQHMIRVQQAKSIGLQKGVLDLIWVAPGREIETFPPSYCPPATYGFDAKVDGDYLHDAQIKFIENLRKCGGNGWEFRTLQQFKDIFIPLYLKHYGPIN
jgi:hypothetical protein